MYYYVNNESWSGSLISNTTFFLIFFYILNLFLRMTNTKKKESYNLAQSFRIYAPSYISVIIKFMYD